MTLRKWHPCGIAARSVGGAWMLREKAVPNRLLGLQKLGVLVPKQSFKRVFLPQLGLPVTDQQVRGFMSQHRRGRIRRNRLQGVQFVSSLPAKSVLSPVLSLLSIVTHKASPFL